MLRDLRTANTSVSSRRFSLSPVSVFIGLKARRFHLRMVFEPPRLAARLSPRGAAAEDAAHFVQRHTAARSFPVRDLPEERWALAMEQAGRERSDEMTAKLRERLERAEVASREMLAELSDAHEAHSAIARELEEERACHAALQSAHERMLELRAAECAAAAATIGQLEARLSDNLRGRRRDAWPPSEQEGRVGLGGEWELVLLRREMAAQEGQQAELEASLVDALEVSRLRRDALDVSNAQVEQLCATATRWQELAIGAARRTEVVWSSLAAELHEDDSWRRGHEANSEELRAAGRRLSARRVKVFEEEEQLEYEQAALAVRVRQLASVRRMRGSPYSSDEEVEVSVERVRQLEEQESELRVQLHKALRVSMARAADLEAVKETAAAATKRAEALAALLEKNGTLKLRSAPERDVAMAASLGELDRLEEKAAVGSSWHSGSEAVHRPAGGSVKHKAPGAKTTPQALLEATQAELAAARRASATWEERAHAFKAEWEALQRDRQVEREEAQRMIQEYDAHAASASLENAWKRIGAALAAAHYVHNAKAAHLQQCADLVSEHEVHIADLKRRHEMMAAAAEATLRREIDAVTKVFATTLRLEEVKCVRLEDEVARLTSQLELATTTSRELDQKGLMDRLSSEAALGLQEQRFREEIHAVEERANRTRLVGELWREVLLVDLRAEEADKAARESRIKRCELLVAQQEKVQQQEARRAMALIAHAEADTLRCKKEVEAERAIARHVILQLESVGQMLSNELRSMSDGVHALESAQPHWHALHAQTVAAGVELRVVCKELAILERNHADLGCIARATSRDLSTAKRSLCVEVASLERKLASARAFARRGMRERDGIGAAGARSRALHSHAVSALARASNSTEIHELQRRLQVEHRLRREAEEVLRAVVIKLGEVESKEVRLVQAAQIAKDEQARWQASAKAAWSVAERESKLAHAHQLARLGEQLSSAEQIVHAMSPTRIISPVRTPPKSNIFEELVRAPSSPCGQNACISSRPAAIRELAHILDRVGGSSSKEESTARATKVYAQLDAMKRG